MPAPYLVFPAVAIDAAAGPLTAQVARALDAAIRSGRIKPGTRLPPSRDAAVQLGVGRNTVVDAYAELLAQGLLETRGRHGTFVATPPQAATRARAALPNAVRPVRLLGRLGAPPHRPPTHAHDGRDRPGWQDWRLGQSGAQLLPLGVWRTACREAGRHLPPAGYGDPRGDAGLREAIVDWLRRERGAHVDPAQVIVTAGTAAGIELLARVLLRPGDVCVVERPGYPRAAQALAAAGATLRQVPVDAQGLVVDEAFADGPPALLHLTPAHQHPLGGRLSGARRRALAALVQRHGCLVLENEYDHEFIHEGQNHAPLASALPDHTVLLGTFAKAVSPALRLGFLAAPLPVADALARAIEAERSHTAWPAQATMQWLLRSGELQRHLRRVRRHHALQRAQLLALLRERCPALQVSGQQGGLHLVLSLGSTRKDRGLAAHIRRQQIGFQTVRDFGGTDGDAAAADALLLGYGHMRPKDLQRAVAVLAQHVG